MIHQVMPLPPPTHTLLVACADSPCGNGTCYIKATGGYECKCQPGFYGVNCNITSNELCENKDVRDCNGNGICTIINDPITDTPAANCTCFPEYDHSSRCLLLIAYNICADVDPCMKGGICHYVFGNNYRCECPTSKREREREREGGREVEGIRERGEGALC